MNTFKQDCMYSARNGFLLLSCKHCANRIEMKYQDGGNIPTCASCYVATGDDWLYAPEAIDHLKMYYPIPSVLQELDKAQAIYDTCMAQLNSVLNSMKRK